MDRGAWPATVHGVAKELDMTEQLDNKTTLYWEFGVTWPGSSGSVSPGLQSPSVLHEAITFTPDMATFPAGDWRLQFLSKGLF